ncbi:hypothetical protein GBA52_014826 [Prunus armeniaca]|nr:hypothetical protein GBA52_014826 [Prunus armeniaca]
MLENRGRRLIHHRHAVPYVVKKANVKCVCKLVSKEIEDLIDMEKVSDNVDQKKQWKRVEVKLEDHVHVPIFPSKVSPESYDEYFDDYISNIAAEKLPQNRPLWEIHILKYPTSHAAGTLIFKLHHALGDGYSLMGALLSCLQSAQNPSVPLTFPSLKSSGPQTTHKTKIVSQFFSSVFQTVSDFSWSILKSNFVEDDRTPIRSGEDGVEFRPITLSTLTFSIDEIKRIKNKLGVGAARYIHGTLKNSSLTISNMIGPVEQMALANQPVCGFYYMVVGPPQCLTITALSYMGKLRVAFGAEKGFIDSHKLKASMQNAFGVILEASYQIPPAKAA